MNEREAIVKILIEKNNLPDGFDQFIGIAKKVKSGKDFVKQARNIKGVPSSTSQWFMDKYDKGRWDMVKASDDFVKDVHKGKYD